MGKHKPTAFQPVAAQTTEPATPVPTCQACRFYGELANLQEGFCRRYPPSLPNPLGYGAHVHPGVLPFDWCGEFKARDSGN